MNEMDWFMLLCAALFLGVWVWCGDSLEEKPIHKHNFEPDTNDEDFLEIFNND